MRYPALVIILTCCVAISSVVASDNCEAWEALGEAQKWELQMLGVTGAERLAELHAQADQRVVTIGIVGLGGISRVRLREVMNPGSSFVYRSAPGFPNCDPKKSTHDTGQAKVVMALAAALGMRVRLASYQPKDGWEAVAKDLAAAGERCDIVLCFHSFWGENKKLLTDAIASRPQALFIAPYAEVGDRSTSDCMQAASAKPWGEGLENFITCTPLAKRSDGALLRPANRTADDGEIINFAAPSYYASGPGGTCPAAATTAAVAGYLYAAAAQRPTPNEVVALLRQSAGIDEAALTSTAPFTGEHVERLEASIAELMQPGPGGPRKLDAGGVISLYRAYLSLQGDK